MCGGCVVDDVRSVVVFSCLGGNGSHGGAKFVRSGVRGACGVGGYPAMLLWVLLWAHIAARCWVFLFSWLLYVVFVLCWMVELQ